MEDKPFRKQASEAQAPMCPYCGRAGVSVRVHGDMEDKFIGISCQHQWTESDLDQTDTKATPFLSIWRWIGNKWRWDALLSVGALGMARMGEYGVALALLFVAGIAATSKISQWGGLNEHQRITKGLRRGGYALVLAAFVLVSLVMNKNRGTASWSNFSPPPVNEAFHANSIAAVAALSKSERQPAKDQKSNKSKSPVLARTKVDETEAPLRKEPETTPQTPVIVAPGGAVSIGQQRLPGSPLKVSDPRPS